MKRKIKLCTLPDLGENIPTQFIINSLDLVAIRYGEEVSVLYGRCLHRGALIADTAVSAGSNSTTSPRSITTFNH